MKNKIVIGCLICILMLTGCRAAEETINFSEETSGEEQTDSDDMPDMLTDEALEQSDSIYVYICGQIRNPGVYEMPYGSRLYEVINRAGGFTDAADKNYLNQAETVGDSQKIYVPSKKDAMNVQAADSLSGNDYTDNNSKALININTADKNELLTIKGIGEARAEEIIAYRQANGGFASIEDIKKVSGIKEGLFSKIKDQITVN